MSYFIYLRSVFILNILLSILWTSLVVIPTAVINFDYSPVFESFYMRNILDGEVQNKSITCNSYLLHCFNFHNLMHFYGIFHIFQIWVKFLVFVEWIGKIVDVLRKLPSDSRRLSCEHCLPRVYIPNLLRRILPGDEKVNAFNSSNSNKRKFIIYRV